MSIFFSCDAETCYLHRIKIQKLYNYLHKSLHSMETCGKPHGCCRTIFTVKCAHLIYSVLILVNLDTCCYCTSSVLLLNTRHCDLIIELLIPGVPANGCHTSCSLICITSYWHETQQDKYSCWYNWTFVQLWVTFTIVVIFLFNLNCNIQ